MNAKFLALLYLFSLASSVQGDKLLAWSNKSQWSSNITIQISKEGAQATAACSEAALLALRLQVDEWLWDELIDLFGQGAFTLGQVTSVEVFDGNTNTNTISLVASFECLACSKVMDQDSIDYILLFFMQHMMDEWIKENNANVLAGCMGEAAHDSNVFLGDGAKAVSIV
jgi:hypothetical protein